MSAGVSGAPAGDERAIGERMIARMGLDLSGLSVYTEAASGPYLYGPVIAAMAGADAVFAVTDDSRFASKEEVREGTVAAATDAGAANCVHVGFERDRDWLARSDIITNTGFVRPIDAELISALKPTAVIPLMWETWELRPGELDLEEARRRGILVLGTRETEPPCDMRPYLGELATGLLGELEVDPEGARVVLLGGQALIAGAMRDELERAGAELDWFATGADGARPYEELPSHLAEAASELDALLVAEHGDDRLLVGPGGLVDPPGLHASNPDLRVGVVAGNVDAAALAASGLRFAPALIRPFGEMSYQSSDLNAEAVLMLHTAGLRVGEAMARARLNGASVREAARAALASSPAMDFAGELAWS